MLCISLKPPGDVRRLYHSLIRIIKAVVGFAIKSPGYCLFCLNG